VYQRRVRVNRLNYESPQLTTGEAAIRLDEAGRYRIRTKFIWSDTDWKSHVQKSRYTYFLITK
jgi:hypothetical protein